MYRNVSLAFIICMAISTGIGTYVGVYLALKSHQSNQVVDKP